MTQENKELLLKELGARMPYGLKVKCDDYLFTFDEKHMGIGMLYSDYFGEPIDTPKIILSGCFYGDDIKPYLFPLSSMTEQQRKEYEGIIYKNIELHCERYYDVIDIDDFECLMDFYHKYHFDYRGLINVGLAIDATNLNIYSY